MTTSLLSAPSVSPRLGSQTPRVANYPPHPFSAAPECIDAAADFGLILDDWQCFVLEHGLGQTLDERWTATRVGCWVPRQNGKGGVIEALVLYWLFFTDEKAIVYSAHQDITAAKMWERVCRLVMSTPEQHDLVLGAAYDSQGRPDLGRTTGYRARPGERAIELADGRKVEFATRSGSRMRGFTVGKLVFDEAQELDAEQMAALLPTLSAVPGQQSWYFGTPPTDATAWCYGLKEDGEAGDTARLAWFDWGIAWVDQRTSAGRAAIWNPDTWYAANPALGVRMELTTVEDESRPSGLGEKFPQERCGMWQPKATTGGQIDLSIWEHLGDPQSRRQGDVALAVDIAPLRDWAAIGLYGLRDDELGHLQLVDYRPGVDWLIGRMTELRGALNPIGWAMARGTYASMEADLRRAGFVRQEKPPTPEEPPERGAVYAMSAIDMAAACGQIIDAVKQRTLRHKPEQPLDAAVPIARTQVRGDSVAWTRKDSDGDVTPLVAVTEARWLHGAWTPLMADYDPLDSIY